MIEDFEKRIIVTRTRLEGSVKLSGAKNAALKHLAASILTDKVIELHRSPNELLDMKVHIAMLNKMGKKCLLGDSYIKISEENSLVTELLWSERSIRNSLLILGALTTRLGAGKVPLPGGCKLGDRKFDIHVDILRKMGADVWEENGCLCAEVSGKLHGTQIYLPIRSTGATENAILCACLANGITTIWNPHIRPEILDLISLLIKMGAEISVFGQRCIVVQGVESLHGAKHTVIPDNMEAITWAIASVITEGDIEIIDFPFEHLEVPLIFLRESGMKYFKGENSLIVRGGCPYPIEISTGTYPGINSDMQPLFAVYGACSKGKSKITDLRFPGRYGYAEELAKMGVKCSVNGDMLEIEGGGDLVGTTVKAIDLRAGISLLLAGLVAEGETIIEHAWQIERGYERLEEKLSALC